MTSQQRLSLDPEATTDADVVISQGAGTASTPVQGGTSDVQVLTYDPTAGRWNVAFDASQKVVTDSTTVLPDSGPQPLLPQDHPVENVTALPVQFAAQSGTDLAIYGLDDYYNHPAGILGIIKINGAAATLVFDNTSVDMSVPTVTGKPGAQTLTVTADWDSPIDPACCPVRKYTRTIGFDGHSSITVLTDDRPYLGAWLNGESTEAQIVSIDPGSPAQKVGLRIGDTILGLTPSAGPNPTNTEVGPIVVDQIALHHAGDDISLHIERAGATMQVPVTLGSQNDTAADVTSPTLGNPALHTDPDEPGPDHT